MGSIKLWDKMINNIQVASHNKDYDNIDNDQGRRTSILYTYFN